MGRKVKELGTCRRNIELLFKQLLDLGSDYEYPECKKLDAECDALYEKLLSNPRYKLLCKKRDAAYDRRQATRRKVKVLVDNVRRKYWAEGITEGVLKDVKALTTKVSQLKNNS